MTKLLFDAFGIIFIYLASKEGMIISNITRLLPDTTPWYITFPLYRCLTCMTSVWGVIFYLSAYPLTWDIVPHLMALGGILGITDIILERLSDE